MINHRNRRLLILAIIFVVFNILAFVIPFRRNVVFWTAYAFTAVMILAQVATDMLAFRNADTLRKVFYGIPIIKIAYGFLCIQLILCAGLMVISLVTDIPVWIVIIPCILVFAFSAIAIIKADWTRDKIEETDAKSIEESKFFHQLRADLESLIPRISDNELKKKIEILSEAARYSDPISSAGLAELETEMENKLASLKQAVISGGADSDNLANELSFLLYERNNKCRVLRQQQ